MTLEQNLVTLVNLCLACPDAKVSYFATGYVWVKSPTCTPCASWSPMTNLTTRPRFGLQDDLEGAHVPQSKISDPHSCQDCCVLLALPHSEE